MLPLFRICSGVGLLSFWPLSFSPRLFSRPACARYGLSVCWSVRPFSSLFRFSVQPFCRFPVWPTKLLVQRLPNLLPPRPDAAVWPRFSVLQRPVWMFHRRLRARFPVRPVWLRFATGFLCLFPVCFRRRLRRLDPVRSQALLPAWVSETSLAGFTSLNPPRFSLLRKNRMPMMTAVASSKPEKKPERPLPCCVCFFITYLIVVQTAFCTANTAPTAACNSDESFYQQVRFWAKPHSLFTFFLRYLKAV